MNNIALTIYHPSAHDFIHTDFVIEKLDSDCAFSEGPIWHPDGFYLFSDIPKNSIEQITVGEAKRTYLKPSGFTGARSAQLAEQLGSNGLGFDAEGNLLICQHGNGAVALYDGKNLQPFIATYNGKTFNSPNDIIIHKASGTVFFSDPPYGLKDTQLQPDVAQSFAGFYYWRDGVVMLLNDEYKYPNGVCLSPDGASLYTCSSKPFENFVLEFDVSTLQKKRIVCHENGDGIECDKEGNIYLCAKEGIVIVNPQGERLARITFETVPANACWGGTDGNDLFITARQNIFLIRNLQR